MANKVAGKLRKTMSPRRREGVRGCTLHDLGYRALHVVDREFDGVLGAISSALEEPATSQPSLGEGDESVDERVGATSGAACGI
jgi:hypothetical protein